MEMVEHDNKKEYSILEMYGINRNNRLICAWRDFADEVSRDLDDIHASMTDFGCEVGKFVADEIDTFKWKAKRWFDYARYQIREFASVFKHEMTDSFSNAKRSFLRLFGKKD